MLKNHRRKWPKKSEMEFMNSLFQTGFFCPITRDSFLDSVFGINSFCWDTGFVKEERGQFLGGGIHQSFGYTVRLGEDIIFHTDNFGYALRMVYNYILKHHQF